MRPLGSGTVTYQNVRKIFQNSRFICSWSGKMSEKWRTFFFQGWKNTEHMWNTVHTSEEVPKCWKMGMKLSKISLIFHLHFPVILVLSFQHLSFLWHFGTEFSRSDISLTFWYWIFKIWHLSDISVSFSDILVLDPQGPIRKWADRIDVKILISKLVYILRFISEIRTRPALEN